MYNNTHSNYFTHMCANLPIINSGQIWIVCKQHLLFKAIIPCNGMPTGIIFCQFLSDVNSRRPCPLIVQSIKTVLYCCT